MSQADRRGHAIAVGVLVFAIAVFVTGLTGVCPRCIDVPASSCTCVVFNGAISEELAWALSAGTGLGAGYLRWRFYHAA